MFAVDVIAANRHDQAEALDRLGADIHASIVNEDGTVKNIDRTPAKWWRNSSNTMPPLKSKSAKRNV